MGALRSLYLPYMFRCLGLILVLFFALASDCYGQVPGFFMKKPMRKVSIPFHSSNSLIIVAVSINGNASLNFLVDTGVRSNILFSKKLGDELGLEYTRTIDLVGADGTESLKAFISPINSLDLGPVLGQLQSLLVLEEDFFELERVIGVPVYGILGYEFFKFNPVKINYTSGTIEFYEENAFRWRPFFYKKTDLLIQDNKPYIMAKVKQADGSVLDAKLLIDTGANHGLLLNRETTDDITMPPLFIETELGQSLGGVLYGFVGRVNYLKFGGLKMYDVVTSYPEKTSFSHIILSSGRQGSLGAEVLGRTSLIFDYPRNRLFVKKSENFFTPFQYDMSGLSIKKSPGEDFRIYISEVKPASPAQKAGVKVFDEIVSINRVPIFLWDLSEIIKLFRSEANKEIELELKRYSGDVTDSWEDLTITFNLKKQI